MRQQYWRLGLVGLIIAFTLSLHYMVLPLPTELHQILHETDLHRRLCYVPIILGALWFGIKGGLGTAGIISAAILPLAVKSSRPLSSNQDLIEILFYLAIGILTGTLVDHKDRERANKERLEKALAAAERMAALGRASAGIAHEVRTPLGSILGAAEILADDYAPHHPHRPFLDILTEEGRRLSRVVDDFLDLSRPVSVEPTNCPIFPLLQDARSSVEGLAADKGVTLKFPAPPSTETVFKMDGDRVRQALMNLLLNAVQASPKKGLVEVSYRLRPGELEIAISDTGPGVAEEEREKIFEPFYTRRKDGTGLGLPLARQIAVGHGGTVTVASGPLSGATFMLRISGGHEEKRL
jgi:signal transduction histidine kinase